MNNRGDIRLSTIHKIRRVRAAWNAGILSDWQMERRVFAIAAQHRGGMDTDTVVTLAIKAIKK
jgi:hypothetical protein